MPTYDVFDIANYFLLKAEHGEQELLSNLKLQKLVYYAQGIHLAMTGNALFEEDIEAWQYGPVVPGMYHLYKSYGKGGIPVDENFDPDKIDVDTQEFLDEIYDVFGQFSAIRLMEITHNDKCWADAVEGVGIISKQSMANDLKKYLADEQ